MNRTVAATLIATAAGTAVWLFGVAKIIWPAHPQVAALLFTVVTTTLVSQTWPVNSPKKI